MKFSIFGCGPVGLVTGACMADNNKVTLVDVNEQKIESLKQGQLYIYEKDLEGLLKKNRNNLEFTTDSEKAVNESDVIYIAVNTPPTERGCADTVFVNAVAETIGHHLNGYKVIVNKSTVPVGTGSHLQGIIKGYSPLEFDIVSNPEFLREGCAVHDYYNPDRIIIGVDRQLKNGFLDLYRQFKGKILYTDIKSAELIKYVSNTFLALCISYVNSLTQKYPNANVVEEAKKLKQLNPSGFFNVGLGFGGSCFPKDVLEFSYFLAQNSIESGLVKSIITVNDIQQVRPLVYLKRIFGHVKNRPITLLGLSFKPGTDDIRMSPAIPITGELIKQGADITVYDAKAMDNFRQLFPDIKYAPSAEDAVKEKDAVILVTEWPQFEGLTFSKGTMVIDGRNLYNNTRYNIGRGRKQLDFDIADQFLDIAASYASIVKDICHRANANFDDVMKGITLDMRIGNNVFQKFFGKYKRYEGLI